MPLAVDRQLVWSGRREDWLRDRRRVLFRRNGRWPRDLGQRRRPGIISAEDGGDLLRGLCSYLFCNERYEARRAGAVSQRPVIHVGSCVSFDVCCGARKSGAGLSGELRKEERLPFALYSSTQLPMVVAITEIGLRLNIMQMEIATALIGVQVCCLSCCSLRSRTRLSRHRSNLRPPAQQIDLVPPAPGKPSGGGAITLGL